MADRAPDSSEVAGVERVVARLSVSAKFFIVLSLLLSIAAALLVAWTYAEVVSRDTERHLMLADKISVLQGEYEAIVDGQSDLAARATELSAQGRELSTALSRVDADVERRLASIRTEFGGEIQKITRDAAQVSLFLELLEIRHLLRSAALRMHFQNDLAATVYLLEAALSRLQDVDDLVVLPLRTQIEQDLAAITQIATDGSQDPLLKLAAIESGWPGLLTNRVLKMNPTPAAVPSSIGEQVLSELTQLLQVRYLSESDDQVRFDENAYLSDIERDLLRLKFDTAIMQIRMAIIRRDSIGFRKNLKSLTLWHQQFADLNSVATKSNLNAIDELGQLDLATQKYDLSVSLELIDQLVANRR